MVGREGSDAALVTRSLNQASSPPSLRIPNGHLEILLPSPRHSSMPSSPSSSRPQVQRHRSRSISIPVPPQLYSSEGTGAGGHFEAFSTVELILVRCPDLHCLFHFHASLLLFSFFRSCRWVAPSPSWFDRLSLALLHRFPPSLSSDLPFLLFFSIPSLQAAVAVAAGLTTIFDWKE